MADDVSTGIQTVTSEQFEGALSRLAKEGEFRFLVEAYGSLGGFPVLQTKVVTAILESLPSHSVTALMDILRIPNIPESAGEVVKGLIYGSCISDFRSAEEVLGMEDPPYRPLPESMECCFRSGRAEAILPVLEASPNEGNVADLIKDFLFSVPGIYEETRNIGPVVTLLRSRSPLLESVLMDLARICAKSGEAEAVSTLLERKDISSKVARAAPGLLKTAIGNAKRRGNPFAILPLWEKFDALPEDVQKNLEKDTLGSLDNLLRPKHVEVTPELISRIIEAKGVPESVVLKVMGYAKKRGCVRGLSVLLERESLTGGVSRELEPSLLGAIEVAEDNILKSIPHPETGETLLKLSTGKVLERACSFCEKTGRYTGIVRRICMEDTPQELRDALVPRALKAMETEANSGHYYAVSVLGTLMGRLPTVTMGDISRCPVEILRKALEMDAAHGRAEELVGLANALDLPECIRADMNPAIESAVNALFDRDETEAMQLAEKMGERLPPGARAILLSGVSDYKKVVSGYVAQMMDGGEIAAATELPKPSRREPNPSGAQKKPAGKTRA